MIDDLYQELLVEHSRNPRCRGEIPGAPSVIMRNPVCGDEIELWLEISEGKVSQVRFSGQGCLISQSAASMMGELLCGKTLAESREISGDFDALLSGSASAEAITRLGDLAAFTGVSKFPLRRRCAALAFEALLKLLPPQ